MLTVGLTGGIASGKTTAANCFAKHNVPIIDTDQIAHQLVLPKQPALQAIIKHFGDHILDKQGKLKRDKLRDIIFTNHDEKQWLEQLLHPLIRQAVTEDINTLTQQTNPPPYCIVVIPLLVETNVYDWLDHVLVIDIDETIQLQRLQNRDNLNLSQCKAILTSQTSRQARLDVADVVISNNTTLADLATLVDKQHQQFLKLAGYQ